MSEAASNIDYEIDNAAVKVRLMVPADEVAWDRYVALHPDSVFFHRYGWSRLLKRAYNYDSYNLVAECAGKIVGVLPLTLVKSPIAGRALISAGFSVGGGILANDHDVVVELSQKAEALGREHRVAYVELRSETAHLPDWLTKKSTYAGFLKILPDSEEEMLSAIPRKRRAELRKAFALEKEGKLKLVVDRDTDRFFDLYASALRDLGTPVFPKKFIDILVSSFSDDLDILTVEYEGRPVSSLISFYHNERVMPYYVGALPEARKARAFDYIYWQQMLRAKQRDATVFDFGRSKFDAGSFGYKKTWGIEPKALEYQYKLIGASELPDVNPNNPKFALATKVWRRLPVPVATMGGAVLARHFA